MGEGDFAHHVCRHQDIENRLHWVRDAALRENACQSVGATSPNNLATPRQVAVNPLRWEHLRMPAFARNRHSGAKA